VGVSIINYFFDGKIIFSRNGKELSDLEVLQSEGRGGGGEGHAAFGLNTSRGNPHLDLSCSQKGLKLCPKRT